VREYKSVDRWLNNLKPSTSEPYLHFLRRFLEYAKTDPDRLVENAKSGSEASEAVHDQLKAFRRKLEGQGLASYTLQLAYNTVRSFLSWNNIKLSKSPRAFKGRTRYESDRVLEPHEVARMISFAQSTRDKAFVSMLCHAQRVGVLPALRYGMLRAELEKNLNPVVIDVKGELFDADGVNVNKSSSPYRFAIVKETSDLLRQMMQERRDAGEPIDDDSWLFRTYSIKFEGKLRRIARDKRGPAITRDWISEVIKEVAKKAGLQVKRSIGTAVNGKEKFRYEVHSHVFRRYWKRQMKRAGITDGDFLDFLMGHELAYGSAYDKFDRDYVRKEYAKAEPYLTVMVNPEIQELQEEERLKSELAKRNVDAEAEFTKHPTWTRRDRKQWLEVMSRQAMPREKPETSKSDEKKVLVIDESQAENHLNHGYEFVTVLPSGKLLVRLREASE
jgi:integrase